MSLSLYRRLQSLYDAYKATLTLITQLSTFDPSLPIDARLDLSSQIHDNLESHEDVLALLRQELEDTASSRRQSTNNTDHERNADLVTRLTEDLRSARGKFRRAQLQAKKTADDLKRREREALFRRNKEDGNVTSRPSSRIAQRTEKLSQAELALNASQDVTRALRRTHDLLASNLSQSQFAQQTLDESQDALKGLSESYGGTSDLLKASRSLAGQLVRSNKSDSWYLQTAFYIMLITLTWLVFRRWFYGPLWWLVFMPLKVGWKGTMMLVGGGPLVETSVSSSSTSMRTGMKGVPTNPSGAMWKSIPLPAKGGGWGGDGRPPVVSVGADSAKTASVGAETMVEQMGKMLDEANDRTYIDDLGDEERKEQETQPRNSKKRMMEVDVDRGSHDEL